MAQNWRFRAASHTEQVSGFGSTSLTLAAPDGLRDGDLIVIAAMYDFAATAVLPSGFAHVSGSPAAQSTTYKSLLAWKIASGEPVSWQLTRTGSGNFFASVAAAWSKILASPGVVSAAATANSTTVSAPSVTTTAADALVVRVATCWVATSLSFAAGTGRVISINSDNIVLLADQDQASAGGTGTDVATGTPSGALIAFTAAFNQSTVGVSQSVTGSGSITISNPRAISLALTGIAASTDTGQGNPVRYFGIGNIAWANINGATRNYYLEHAAEVVVNPLDNATTLYYSFKPGVTAVITELVRS